MEKKRKVQYRLYRPYQNPPNLRSRCRLFPDDPPHQSKDDRLLTNMMS